MVKKIKNIGKITSVAMLLWVGFPVLTLATEKPRSLATDSRLKVVEYNPNDVVMVVGSHLVATTIQFDRHERIISIVNGDSIAWKTNVNKNTPYMLNIKPILPSSDTNMMVVTDKRNYQFHLITSPSDNARSPQVTYFLNFKYPREKQAELESELTQLQKTFSGNSSNDAIQWNYDYSFYGDKNCAPIQAVDNGTFTIFKFPKNVPIPAIFAVDRDQNESLLNFRVQGDYIFVQGVRHQYTFRNGKDVTTVYNDSLLTH